ncbi:MAG: DUF3489 domain-containing protein [Sphingobium sp.]
MTKRKISQIPTVPNSNVQCREPAANRSSTTNSPSSRSSTEPVETIALANTSAPRTHSKTARLLTLLRTDTGASLSEMIEATGWQAHSVRAALTGLRKRGHAIERLAKEDGVAGATTRWQIVEPADTEASA